jgi:hypothetical protein
MKQEEVVCQFIPIFLIFLLLTRFKKVSVFSRTVLGKWMAICIIVFYTVFILFYQTDFVESMTGQNVPPLINNHSDKPVVDEFRKKNCRQNTLVYKEMPVKNDMATIIFPYLKINSDTVCNPCSSTCSISIIDSKIDTEEELLKPAINTDIHI